MVVEIINYKVIHVHNAAKIYPCQQPSVKFFVALYMLFPVLLLVLQVIFAANSHDPTDYPMHIHELGDFVVKEPVLVAPPEGAVILSAVPLPFELQRPKSISIYSQPALSYAPLEAISTYLMERTVPKMIEFLEKSPRKAFEFSSIERHFIALLKYQTDHFNPSILDGITKPERIVAFGSVFLRIFKAAFPGLFRVKLDREEIASLAMMASGWFMDFSEENNDDKDILLLKCLRIYFPESRNGFNLSLHDFYRTNLPVAFEAALQLNLKKIPNRSQVLLSQLKAKNSLFHFLGDREMFLKVLPGVPNLNLAAHGYGREPHVLFFMIKAGLFYPEAMLRPELKDFRITFYDQNYFEDFYSEALYFAIAYKNSAAINFLLNLDNSYYEVPRPESGADGYQFDSSIDSNFSAATPYLVFHPRPVSVETLNNLRLIFFDGDVINSFPDVYRFTFCKFDMFNLMEMYKDIFPNLKRLQLNYNRLMEERYRDRVPSPVIGQKRRLDRSNSPTIYE